VLDNAWGYYIMEARMFLCDEAGHFFSEIFGTRAMCLVVLKRAADAEKGIAVVRGVFGGLAINSIRSEACGKIARFNQKHINVELTGFESQSLGIGIYCEF